MSTGSNGFKEIAMTLCKDKPSTTVVVERGEVTHVKLHETTIVIFSVNVIYLNSGGFKTRTTMRRMNDVSKEFGLNFHVFNHNGWQVSHCGRLMSFYDGMVVDRP